jgi:hypothetical protein
MIIEVEVLEEEMAEVVLHLEEVIEVGIEAP